MTMIRRLLTIAAIAAAAATAQAREWSLQECVDYAVANNIDVRSRALEVSSARLDLDDARNRFLPTASGYAGQNFNFGRGLTADNTYANRNTSSFSAGLNVNIPVFQGLGAVRRLSYAKANLAAMLEQAEAAKDDVTLNVLSAYLQALYSAELSAVARERRNISARELDRTRILVEQGRLPELDLASARSQLAQDELGAVTAAGDSALALLDLAQILNLDSTEGFAIAALADSLPPLMSVDDVFASALAGNHAMRAAGLSLEAAEKNVAVARSGYLPTISVSAGIGSNYYNSSGIPNESFGSQMRHNFSQSIGINLSVPLFDAFGTRNSVRRARLAGESARLRVDDTRNTLYKAICQAHSQAMAAYQKRTAAAAALESAREAFRAVSIKYENGRANATELEKAKSDYITAMAESVRARYESILRSRILLFYNGDR